MSAATQRMPTAPSPRRALDFANALSAISRTVTSPYPAASSRSEEHTSELQSLMRTSYAVFCLKKKKHQKPHKKTRSQNQFTTSVIMPTHSQTHQLMITQIH